MISEKLKIVQEKISEKCKEANRETSEIKLIAVSKNFGLDDIQAAYNEGIRDFGENKAQELDATFASFGDKIIWHFIGNLQRNKVRFVV
ncbi:MAG: YggS family pyridoxal phosphate-dependent enzyme, partial [Ignavibacteriaceae bacterium]